MDGIIIDVEGYEKPTEPILDEQAVESPLLEKMKLAYVDFFQNQYEPKLPLNGKNEPIYLQFTVIIEEEEERVIFDYVFFEQLCEIYIINGWAGIIAVEKALNEQQKSNASDLSNYLKGKPVKLNVWNFTVLFFNFTKRMLALLIRETLINIEHISAERIIAKLSITNIEIANAKPKYDIQRKSIKSDTLAGHGSGTEIDAEYSIGDKPLAKDLFELLTVAVNEKYNFDNFVGEIGLIQNRIEKSKTSNVKRSPYPQTDDEKKAELENLKTASEKLLGSLKTLFEKQHPLGSLIFATLKKGFEQTEMENLFGLTIDSLQKNLETIADKVNPQYSKVELLIPFQQTDDVFRDILAFKIPADGIEKDVMEKSIAKFADLSFFPLLAEENLNQLFANEIIEIDSFENVVGFHYLSNLIEKLGEIEKEEKKWEDFWKTFSKVASGLSIAALITPQTSFLRPIFRGGAALADVALLAYTIHSITGNLRKSSEILNKKLVNQDDFTTESFAQIGEIISIRKEFRDNLTDQLIKEILSILVLGNLPVFKQALLARSYYSDIETLAESNEQITEETE